MNKLLHWLCWLLILIQGAAFAQNRTLIQSKFRLGINSTSSATQYEWYNTTAISMNGPSVVATTNLNFGAEAYGGYGTAVSGTVAGNVRIYYNVHAVGEPAGEFAVAAMTNNSPAALERRSFALLYSNSGINLATLVGRQLGNYVLEAYYIYDLYNVDAAAANKQGALSAADQRYPASGTNKLTFNLVPPAPTFSPAADTYDGPIEVTIAAAASEEGATLRYTIDGSEPSATNGLDYTGPFTLAATATVRAKSFWQGVPASQTGTIAYRIEPYNPNIYPRFVVRGTQIFQKNSLTDSTLFKIEGTNINGPNWNWDFEDNLKDSLKMFNVWGFNSVRINVFINSYQKSTPRTWNAADDAYLDLIIEKLTKRSAKRIVCMIEVHDYSGSFPGRADRTSTADFLNWWQRMARRYKNNPYVWFNIMNEPGFTSSLDYTSVTNLRNSWVNIHTRAIDTIRATSAENIIIVNAANFASEAVGYGTVDDASPHKSAQVTANQSSVLVDGATILNHDPKKNVAFTLHPYTGWETPGKFKNYMDRVREARDAGNPLCVFVTEFMSTFRRDSGLGWRGGWASRSAWELLKWYREENGDNLSPGWMVWHWVGAGLQKLTYNGGGKDVNTNSFNVRPTNLTRDGGWVWDMIHDPASLVSWIPVSTETTKLEMEDSRGWKEALEFWPGWSASNIPANTDRYTLQQLGFATNTWTEWDINVQQAGTYRLIIRGNNKSLEAGQFEVRDFAGNIIGRASIPANTTSDINFQTSSFSLSAGNQILRLNKVNAAEAQYTYVLIVPAEPDTQAPSQPQSLIEFSSTDKASLIQWSASTDNEGVRGYEVYRNGQLISFTGNTFLVDQGLTAGTTYTYTVQAIDNSDNKSQPTNPLTVSTASANGIVYTIDNKDTGTGLNKITFNAIATSSTANNGWWPSNNAANYGGSEHYTTQNNATLTTTFIGVQARVYGTLKSNHGNMMASIDGGAEYSFPVSFFTPGPDKLATFVFATPILSNGEHTLNLRNLGSYVAIDRIEISSGELDTQAPTVPAGLTTFYQTDKQVMLQWNASTDNIRVTAYEVFNNGVSVGKTSQTYFPYAFTTASGETASFTVAALDLGENRSAPSAALAVVQRPAPGLVTYIDDKTEGTGPNQVEFSAKDNADAATNGWKQVNVAGNYGGSEIYTTKNGATATIRFYGNQLAVYGTKKSNHGEMKVSVDGGAEYAVPASFRTDGGTQVSAFIWATPDLELGNHTVVLRNLGQYVSFDHAQAITLCNLALTLTKTDVTCNGATNGKITATATGANGAATYRLLSGTTEVSANATGIFTNLAAGPYSVEVKDANGCTASATVTVGQPAALAASLAASAEQVCKGQSLTLTAVVSGGTAPYQYSFDGGAAYASANEFTVSNLMTSATYAVSVKDANQCVTTGTVKIVVNETPAITAQPQKTVGCPNGTATFTVVASGTVTGYAWYKGSVALSNSGKYAGVNTATLTISGLIATDADSYWVKVTGPCGTVNSSQSPLVFNPPVSITNQSSDVKVSGENSTATLSVEAANASAYQWQKRASNGSWNNLVNSNKE